MGNQPRVGLCPRVPTRVVDMRKLVGGNLKQARLARGLTQQQLADAAGSSTQYISGLEMGHRNPTVITVYRLADALDVSHVALLFPGLFNDGARDKSITKIVNILDDSKKAGSTASMSKKEDERDDVPTPVDLFRGINKRPPKDLEELEQWLSTSEGRAATMFSATSLSRWGESRS